MNSFIDIEKAFGGMPPRLGALLSRVDEAKGRWQIPPQLPSRLLRDLAARTRFESIWASSAIAGLDVSEQRVERLIGEEHSHLRNRREQEVAGYRDAFDALISNPGTRPAMLARLLETHGRLLAQTKDAGTGLRSEADRAKRRKGNPAARGGWPPPAAVEKLIGGLCTSHKQAREDEVAHPLLLAAAFALDLCAIRPFLQGNDRISRLLFVDELIRCGYVVPRYVSFDLLIHERQADYLEALSQSRVGWQEGEHRIWSWAELLVSLLAEAQGHFDERVRIAQPPRGTSKQEWVRRWVLNAAPQHFLSRDARIALPGISDETIRVVLQALRDQGALWCDGTGPTAAWHKAT